MNEIDSGTVSDIIFAGTLRIGRVQAGQNYYAHLDLLGSVRRETTSANVTTFTAKYLAYGTPYATSGSSLFQYTGKQLDQSTGLHYYGYRYYDSLVGRFISLDPLEAYNLSSPQSANRYTYALNNPFRYTDPDGRWGSPGAQIFECGYVGTPKEMGGKEGQLAAAKGKYLEASSKDADKLRRDCEKAVKEAADRQALQALARHNWAGPRGTLVPPTEAQNRAACQAGAGVMTGGRSPLPAAVGLVISVATGVDVPPPSVLGIAEVFEAEIVIIGLASLNPEVAGVAFAACVATLYLDYYLSDDARCD